MPLTALPPELIDEILGYLDWDSNEDITPHRPSLFQASLACKLLRDSAVPRIFKIVTLKLRWANNTLLEPRLVMIRRTPRLTQHIRTIHIATQFRQQSTKEVGDGRPYKQFALPDERHDWLNPISTHVLPSMDNHDVVLCADYRRRVNDMLVNRFSASEETLLQSSAEEFIHRAIEHTQDILFEDKAIAASIAMLCMPASTQSIIFECLRLDRHDPQQSVFAFNVLVTAIELFQPRLVSVTLLENLHHYTDNISLQRAQSLAQLSGDLTDIVGSPINGNQLMPINSLSLASYDRVPSFARRGTGDIESLRRWIPLNQSLERLELCFVAFSLEVTDVMLANFISLKVLNIHDAWVDRGDAQDGLQWLILAIRIRRVLPKSKILLERLSYGKVPRGRESTFLPPPSTDWLVHEAIPAGTTIDVVREDRLCTDFQSFRLLWEVDSGDRGDLAKTEWDSTFEKSTATRAKLVDAAMARRWRGI